MKSVAGKRIEDHTLAPQFDLPATGGVVRGHPRFESVVVRAGLHGLLKRPLTQGLEATLDEVQCREQAADEIPPDAAEAGTLVVDDGLEVGAVVLDHNSLG